MSSPFYMVWKSGGSAPKVQHPTLDSAATEAARLSAANPWDAFYVLEAVGSPVGPIRTDERPEPVKKNRAAQAQMQQSPLTPEQQAERAAKKAQRQADYEAKHGGEAVTNKTPLTLADVRKQKAVTTTDAG